MSVFISYSTLDESYARRLASAFSLNHIPYWFAPKDIKGGENFADRIQNELSRHRTIDVYERLDEDFEQLTSPSTELFLLMLSKNSMNSKWVKKELISAIDEDIPLLVLKIDNTPITSGFAYLLKDIQVIKAYHLNKQSMERVIGEIVDKIHLTSDIITGLTEKRLTYHDIGVYPITEGDPYFIEGETLITSLSTLCFYLAPPKEELDNPDNQSYFERHTFSKTDVVFDSTLDNVCSKIALDGLREMIENSRKKIFQQFLRQENGCYYNNKKYGINKISAYERTEDVSEDPIARIEFYTTDYFTHRVMKDICKQIFRKGGSYFKELNYTRIGEPRIFFTSLGINLLLTDHAGNVLLTGRSTNASETYDRHRYSVSVIEGVSQSDYDNYEKRINLRLSILRGIKEELGVDEHFLLNDSIRIYDIFVNTENQEFGISCSVELQYDVSLQKDIVHLKGKDEALEVAEKKIIPVSQLGAFIMNNKSGMLPQAVYTVCVYLEANGIYLIERQHRDIIRESRFIMGKNGSQDWCGDAYVWGENYIAVIDGATPKGSLLWDGMKGDVFISHLLVSVIEKMDKNLSGPEAITYLNLIVKDEYQKHGVEFSTLKPEERLQCSVLIYSRVRNEIWSFGDCMLKINEREFYNIKDGDRMLSALRAFCIQIEKDRTGDQREDLQLSEYGRRCILPYLKQYVTLANRNVPFGYDVLDGGSINASHVKIYAVQKNDFVVMATDGYPRLFDSLESTEKYLQMALEVDPMCIGILQGTKGISEGNVSYDDRTYLSFKVL